MLPFVPRRSSALIIPSRATSICTWRSLSFGLCNIHLQNSAIKFFVIKVFNRCICGFFLVEGDESKAPMYQRGWNIVWTSSLEPVNQPLIHIYIISILHDCRLFQFGMIFNLDCPVMRSVIIKSFLIAPNFAKASSRPSSLVLN